MKWLKFLMSANQNTQMLKILYLFYTLQALQANQKEFCTQQADICCMWIKHLNTFLIIITMIYTCALQILVGLQATAIWSMARYQTQQLQSCSRAFRAILIMTDSGV